MLWQKLLQHLNQEAVQEGFLPAAILLPLCYFEECCCSEYDYCTVDRPAHDHGKQCIGEFEFQLFFYDFLVFKVPLALCMISEWRKML